MLPRLLSWIWGLYGLILGLIVDACGLISRFSDFEWFMMSFGFCLGIQFYEILTKVSMALGVAGYWLRT